MRGTSGHEDQKENESRVELRAKSLSLGNDAWRTAAEWLGRRQTARSEMKIENDAQKGLVRGRLVTALRNVEKTRALR